MPVNYPVDRSAFMSKEGPPDPRFRIPEGELVYWAQRDARFPYLYHVLTHALVHSPDHFKLILIRVVDTSVKARIRCAQFDRGLSVPLRPNALGRIRYIGGYSDSHKNLIILLRFIGNETWHNFIRPTIARRQRLL